MIRLPRRLLQGMAVCVLAFAARAQPGAPPPLEALDADAGPVAGVDVRGVAPGGQGSAAGIRPGEVLVAVEGVPLLEWQQLEPLVARFGAGSRFTFAAADGRTREVVFSEGTLGLSLWNRPERLTLAVSRAMTRDDAWNDALLAAAFAIERFDVETAAEHLDAARAAGCPEDDVLRGLAFRIAAGRGDHAEADELLATLPPRTDPQIQLHLPGLRDRYRHFRASGRTDRLVHLVEQRPDVFHFARRPHALELTALLKAGGPAPAAPSDPAVEASTVPVRIVNPMLHGAARWFMGADLHTHNTLIVANRPFLVEQRPGFYKQSFLTRNEPVGDFDLHARFTVKPSGLPDGEWPSNLLLNVCDYDRPAPDPSNYFDGEVSVLGASFTIDRSGIAAQSLLHGWNDRSPLAPSFFDGTTEHHLHLSRRDGRRTLALDGRVLLNLPADPTPRNLAFHLHVVGLTARFSTFEITEPFPAVDLHRGSGSRESTTTERDPG